MRRPDLSDEINAKTAARVRSYLESRDDWNLSKSLKNLVEQAVMDYDHRALLELIQNAHDAHPPGRRDGRILVRLDHDAGAHGNLIVANTGQPFTRSNFDAICDVAQSDKRADEGIGNKGIGFKSTLQLCRIPEIYSAESEREVESLDGYCFRFADQRDFLGFVDGDPELASEIAADVFHLCLPVALSEVPRSIEGLASEGYVTVVRLELKSEAAREEAEREVRSLEEFPPTMLFLRRVSEIVIEETRNAHTDRRIHRRSERKVAEFSPATVLNEVDLGDGGRFLVAERVVDGLAFKSAIEASVAAERISDGWRDWAAEARVGVAVRLDESLETGRLFAFLPMGEHATAPLPCHVNAPFFAKLARVDFEASVPLNDFLLDDIAMLSASLVLQSATGSIELLPTAIADLLSWSAPAHSRLLRAFGAHGADLATTPVLPLRQHRGRRAWGDLVSTRTWDDNGRKVLTAAALARSRTIHLLDPGISGTRLDRLNRLVRSVVGEDLDPDDEEIAACAESLATSAEKRPFNRRWWEQFYDELADMIHDPQALRGRRVLVDDDGKVQRCPDPSAEKPGPTPFFSPRSEGEAREDLDIDLRIPPSLKRQIFFVNQQLTWTLKSGSTRNRSPGRRLLGDGDLVKDYHASELFSVIGRALSTKPTAARSKDSLKWIYDFARSREEPPWNEIAGVQFRVPTVAGDWIPANEAMFSRSWGGFEEGLLEDLLARAPDTAEQLIGLGSRLLIAAQDWPFPFEDLHYLRGFLERLGVRSGLVPVAIPRSTLSADGLAFEQLYAANSVPLPQHTRDLWKNVLSAHAPTGRRPYTNYRSRTPLYRLPGQDDYDQFDDESRRLYARLIVAGLEWWPDSTLSVEVRRYNDTNDRFSWPSPMWAFLKEVDWLPMSRAGERELWYFERPSVAWSDGMGDETARPFAPLVPFAVRRLMESRPRSRQRLTDLGMQHWDSTATAGARLRLLAQLLANGLVPDSATASFRKAYEDAWEEFFRHPQPDPFEPDAGVGVIVSRRGRVELAPLDDEERTEPIYIQDSETTQALRLLEQRGAAVMRFRRSIGQEVADLLRAHLGDRVRKISDTEVTVIVDGERFEPKGVGELLVTEERRWLIDLVASLVDLRSGQFRRLGPEAIRRTIDTLGRVRLVFAQQLDTLVDGARVDTVGRVLALADNHHPTVILERSDVEDESALLQAVAPAIAEILGFPDLAASIRLSLIDLDRAGSFEGGAPSLAAIAEVIGEPEHRLHEITTGAQQPTLDMGRLIAPLLSAVLPDDANEFWEAMDALSDEQAIRDWLSPRLEGTWLSADALVDACRQDDLNAARVSLGISLPDLNAAIRRLGAPFEPLRNAEGIDHSFRYFIRTRREALLSSLRTAFAPTYRRKEPLDEYVARRDLNSLKPDPDWPDRYFDLDDQTITDRINQWLSEVGAPPLLDEAPLVPPIDEIRRQNRTALHEFVVTSLPVIAAWEQANSMAPSGLPGSAEAVTDLASNEGWLDFEPLTAGSVIGWLIATGRWPADMPPTVELDELSLSADEISAAIRHREAADRQRIDQSRQIKLDDTVLDASQENYAAVVDSIAASIRPSLLARPARVADLAAMEAGATRRRGGTRGGVTAGRHLRLSDVQASAVGLAGEVVALEWLRAQYEDATEGSWRSGYRNLVLGGTEGDDSLGYDFEIITPKHRLLFEVKTTVGDNCTFELTDNEIRAAQRLRRGDRFYVLFVTHVLNSDDRAIYLLPNPFSAEAMGLYRTVGAGLRLSFSLAN